MNATFRLAALLALVLPVTACNGSGAPNVPSAGLNSTAQGIPQWKATNAAHAACPGPRTKGLMQCDVLIDNAKIAPDTPGGWGPPSLEAYYNLPSASKGSGQIVAIVDAYDQPNVASDLAAYRTEFNLGTAHFKKFNQKGQQKNYPVGNAGWGTEISLDVEMVSAGCPKCTIYLVEADSPTTSDLFAAEKEAVKLGAHIVSNSWGGGAGNASKAAFDAPHVLYLASAGDSAYGMQDPADYDTVLSVGGTILQQNGSGAYDEIVWPDSGGGCSVVAKPSWQKDPTCTNRTGNDLSAVAFWTAVYDTYGGDPGWFTVRGTSVASPLLASMFALAGNAQSEYGGKNVWRLKAKEQAKDFHTNITGSIANCPTQYQKTYVCDAQSGQFGTYSGPTGWGSPNGIAGL